MYKFGGNILPWLGKQPFILLFLVVAGGYALGRIKVRGIGLGATASSLLIGLGLSLWAALIGIRFSIPDLVSTTFFNLFMFSVGMKVGPQFLSGLRRDAAKFIFFGLFIPLLSIGLLFALRAVMHFVPGLAPGILAGANTATPGLGAAQAAYTATLKGGAGADEAIGNLSTAFAFSYCISMTLFVLLMKLPDLLGRDTPKAAQELEAHLRGSLSAPLPGAGDEFLVGPLPVGLRSYTIEQPMFVGQQLRDLRRTYPLVSVEQIRRAGKLLEPVDDIVLQPSDTVALYGPISRMIAAAPSIGPEVDVPEMRDTATETADVVVHRKTTVGKPLVELARNVGHGLFLNAMFRGGTEIPHGPDTIVLKGDVLRVTGAKWRIKAIEDQAGRVVHPSISTDIVTLALGLTAGAALGVLTLRVGALKLSAGSAVGLLLVGIALSILRTRFPALGGPFPEPARQLLEDLGLNVFIAVLGINSGAGVLHAIGAGALTPILVGCLVVGFIPPIIAWLLGIGPFKMNDALLLGAVAGGRCNSAGMRAAQEVSQSTVPAISYPVTFALSNVVMTVATYVIAMLG